MPAGHVLPDTHYQRAQGAMMTKALYLPRQRVVNGMQSEGRVVSHLTDVIRMVFSYRPTGIPGVPLLRKSVLTDQLRPGVTPG
jgi:hypothetical protein